MPPYDGDRNDEPRRLMVLLLLLVAISAEVAATIMLKASEGFSRLLPSAVVVIGYASSYIALGFAMKLGLNLSTGYAVWAGLGAVAATLAGVFLFQERLGTPALSGIALIVLGVVLIHVGPNHAT